MNIQTDSNVVVPVAGQVTGSVVAPVAMPVLGQWYAYDNALGLPEVAGMRGVKCLYKVAEGKSRTHANSYCMVPTAHITEQTVTENIARLAPYLVAYLQGIEDDAVKLAHRNNESRVYTEYLSLERIIESLESSEIGTRLNGEQIGTWFDASLADTLVLTLAGKMGVTGDFTSEQEAKVAGVLAAYRGKFISLASGKTVIKEADCVAMKRVIELAGCADSLSNRFIARLDKMGQKVEEALEAL